MPANSIKRYVFKIDPKYTATIDGVTENLIFYKALDHCHGTACSTPATISGFKMYLTTWGNGPEDTAEEVTNYTSLKPYASCNNQNSGNEYMVALTGTDLTGGGSMYLSENSNCSTVDRSMYIRDGSGTSLYAYLHIDGNYTSPNYYICYKNAINSTTYAKASQYIKFVYDPDNVCPAYVTNFDMTSQTGSITTISHFHLGLDNPVGGASVRMNFSGGKYMCLEGNVAEFTSGYCGDTNNATLVGNNFGTDYGTYQLQSVDIFQSTGCTGTVQNAPVQSATDFTFSPITVTSMDFNYGSGIDELLLTGSSQVYYPALGVSVDMNNTVGSIKYVFDSSREFCVEVPGGYTFYTSFTGTQFNPVSGVTGSFTGGGTMFLQNLYFYGTGDATCSGSVINSINVGGSYSTTLQPPA
jgi:hypothetical protein